MKRRTFVRSTLAASAAMAVPARPVEAMYRELTGKAPDLAAVTGDGREVTIPGTALDDLKGRLRGRLLLAGDDGYDAARIILNPSFDMYPALVVQPTGVADVQSAVNFAREHDGLLLAVKCGGHSHSGKSTCNGGMQIDLSGFRDVRVDPYAKRARVTGGSLLGQLDHEAMAHGLVTPMGTVSHTGVGGLVTGGGFGRVARRYGMSCDNLLSVDVVNADGELRHASADTNQDLFWGVRGGGGNFGIVTSFEFQLHEMERQVVTGSVVYPIAKAKQVLKLFGEYGWEMPDELSVGVALVKAPGDAPGVAAMSFVWIGDPGRVDEVTAPLRGLGSPIADRTQAVDYVALQRSGDTDDPRAVAGYMKSGFITGVHDGLADALAENFQGRSDRRTQVIFQQAGGAIARVSPDATAFAQRNALANMMPGVSWPYGRSPDEHIAWCREYWTHLEPFTHGFYTNDGDDQADATEVGENYQINLDRLTRVKNRYDPENLFRLNANIVPTV